MELRIRKIIRTFVVCTLIATVFCASTVQAGNGHSGNRINDPSDGEEYGLEQGRVEDDTYARLGEGSDETEEVSGDTSIEIQGDEVENATKIENVELEEPGKRVVGAFPRCLVICGRGFLIKSPIITHRLN